ncbi:CPBP family intramembrane glutamic endopeptidase [Brevibacillus ginsengisoli]|uniref:CPBP family intramembrane glutamic endopeptidase n=1 Tax=Brevibacillus ginsengisoli TaxID=363854 RepID=UPI003CEB676F
MMSKLEFQKHEARYYIGTVLLTTWLVTMLLFINPSVGIRSFTFLMFIPAIIAIIFMKITNSKPARFKKRLNMKSLLFGILYPIFFIFLCAFISYITNVATIHVQKGLDLKSIITIIVTLFVSLFAVWGEEYGWRGFLLPRLTEQYGKTKATMIVGIVWALYHVPAVYFLAKTTGIGNPLLLCTIQACVVFTLSFAFSYCYYLSGNLLPVLLFHSVWNLVNTTVLGDIYKNEQGIVQGNLLFINAEGILGLCLGVVFLFYFLKQFKKENVMLHTCEEGKK